MCCSALLIFVALNRTSADEIVTSQNQAFGWWSGCSPEQNFTADEAAVSPNQASDSEVVVLLKVKGQFESDGNKCLGLKVKVILSGFVGEKNNFGIEDKGNKCLRLKSKCKNCLGLKGKSSCLGLKITVAVMNLM